MTKTLPETTFLHAQNADYIAQIYRQYLANSGAVDPSWQSFFRELNDNDGALLSDLVGASWTPKTNQRLNAGKSLEIVTDAAKVSKSQGKAANTDQSVGGDLKLAARDSIQASTMIRMFRARGHMLATLDPLGLMERKSHPELEPDYYGFGPNDLDRPIFLGGQLGFETASVNQILEKLRSIYCRTIGVEFWHLTDPVEREWLLHKIENSGNRTSLNKEEQKNILARLTAAEGFEQFLHTKHVGTKRFGLDGGETLIPVVETVLETGVKTGVREVNFGMAHRGRLNVLTNVIGKPFTAVFSEFQGASSNPEDVQGSGDVKYHMGTSSDKEYGGVMLHLSLTANPSHLEAVNPVVIGKVRAKQSQRKDEDRTQVMPIVMHGDAAFAGQGLVAETLMMSEIRGYAVGGTINIVINNQIGFTTMPQYGRSGPYPTDVAKMLAAPIFHVNSDDPEAAVHVARIATEFRQTFKKDVVIDIVCYRRYGHNEGDEPAFTQPVMYKTIEARETTRALYAKSLVAQGVVSDAEAQKIYDDFNAYLASAFEATKSYKPNKADFLEGAWSGLKQAPHPDQWQGQTAITSDLAQAVGKVITSVPSDFVANTKILRQLDAKKKMFEKGEGFDWATAEALAFGSLISQGTPVRLSGQDVGRGTFSQRHCILYNQDNGEKYIPLKHISPNQPSFEAYDSPLSEAGVLGFEYGYTLADPLSLVMWEAQFGDFVNGAQVIIDQFISSAETKWLRMSGLVMLLPHGFEGQGPEHSSGRVERFLQSCAEDNWQVCNITTPANYFHALRRQVKRDFRKPLIIMTPKSLLRHKLAVSKLEDMTGATRFHRVLVEGSADIRAKSKDVKRVIICSGKVYYDLFEEREKRQLKNVALVRLEQFYPFPEKSMAAELSSYPNAEIVWCQEEPKNMGGWSFVESFIETTLKNAKHKCNRPRYVGRLSAASPATGYLKRHNLEQANLISEALTL